MSAVVSASYDLYYIADQLQERESGVERAELHSITYLACLLAVYDGLPVHGWRYGFTSTKAGAPYAQAVDEALALLEATGAVAEPETLITVTVRGRALFGGLRRLPSLVARERYLEPACNATLALPLPTVTEAVMNEPQLRVGVALGQSRALLDDTGLVLVAQHFKELRSVLVTDPGETSDLLVAAIVWLTYLSQQTRPPEAISAG